MRKFKLNKDSKTEKEPTPEQMKRYKDFATLNHSYERLTKRSRKRLFQDPKFFLLVLIIGIVLLLIFLESIDADEINNGKDDVEQLENE
jgi:hypothetical protein